jgi:hypothetical protein
MHRPCTKLRPPCTIQHKSRTSKVSTTQAAAPSHLFTTIPNRQPFLCQFFRHALNYFSAISSTHLPPQNISSARNSNQSPFASTTLKSLPPPEPLHAQHAFRPPKPTASSRPNSQLRPDSFHRLHDVERLVCNRRLALTHCRRPFWVHGASLPTRRSVVFME